MSTSRERSLCQSRRTDKGSSMTNPVTLSSRARAGGACPRQPSRGVRGEPGCPSSGGLTTRLSAVSVAHRDFPASAIGGGAQADERRRRRGGAQRRYGWRSEKRIFNLHRIAHKSPAFALNVGDFQCICLLEHAPASRVIPRILRVNVERGIARSVIRFPPSPQPLSLDEGLDFRVITRKSRPSFVSIAPESPRSRRDQLPPHDGGALPSE